MSNSEVALSKKVWKYSGNKVKQHELRICLWTKQSWMEHDKPMTSQSLHTITAHLALMKHSSISHKTCYSYLYISIPLYPNGVNKWVDPMAMRVYKWRWLEAKKSDEFSERLLFQQGFIIQIFFYENCLLSRVNAPMILYKQPSYAILFWMRMLRETENLLVQAGAWNLQVGD